MAIYKLPYTGGTITLDGNDNVQEAMRVMRGFPLGKVDHLFRKDDVAYVDASIRLVSLLYCYKKQIAYSTGYAIKALNLTLREARENSAKQYPLAKYGKEYDLLSLSSQVLFTAHLLKRSDLRLPTRAIPLPVPTSDYYSLCQSIGIPSKSIAIEAFELFRDNLIHESGMRPFAARHDGSSRYKGIYSQASYNESLEDVLARSGFIGEGTGSIGMINSPDVPHIATSVGLVQITHSQLIIQAALFRTVTPSVEEQAAFFAYRYFLVNRSKFSDDVSQYQRKVHAQDTIMQKGAGLEKRVGSAPPLEKPLTVTETPQSDGNQSKIVPHHDKLRGRKWF